MSPTLWILLTTLGATGFFGGKYVCQGMRTLSAAYDKHVRPILERLRRIRPPEITITRQPDNEGRLCLKLSNVAIINFAKILTEAEEESSNIIDEAGAQQPTALEWEQEQLYAVTLFCTDYHITVGEIDFSDWRGHDTIQVEITKQDNTNAEKLLENSSEYNAVLDTLRHFVKLTGALSCSPSATVSEKISISSGGIGFVDWLRTVLWGERVRLAVDPYASNEPQLQSPSFLSALTKLAVEKDDINILNNYFTVVANEAMLELQVIKAKRLRLEEKIEKQARGRKVAKWTLVGLGIGMLLIIVGLSAVTVFNPPLGVVILGMVSSVTTMILYKLSSSFVSLGVWSLVLGLFFKGYLDYKREELRANRAELKEVQDLEQELHMELGNIKELRAGASDTFAFIKENPLQHNEECILDLHEKNIGNIGVTLICQYLRREENSIAKAITLNLANNGITVNGAILLKELLAGVPDFSMPISELDLRGNPIKKEGVEELQAGLEHNFTLLKLHYDCIVPAKISGEINRQLLLNRYLYGDPLEGESEIDTLFSGGMDGLSRAAVQKVRANFAITTLPIATNNSSISAEVEQILAQNYALTTMANSQEATTIVANCINAFAFAPERALKFIDTLPSEQKKNITIALSRDLKALAKLESESLDELLTALVAPKNREGKNIELLKQLIDALPYGAESNMILEEVYYTLSQTFQKLRADLERKRQLIAEEYIYEGKAQKAEFLRALDLTLHPELGKQYESLNFLRYRAKQLLAIPAKSPQEQESQLTEFIELYGQVSLEDLEDFFTKLDKRKLLSLIVADATDTLGGSYKQLRTTKLSLAHKRALFLHCLKGSGTEKACRKKANFLATIFGDKDNIELAQLLFDSQKDRYRKFREQWLQYGFFAKRGLLGIKIGGINLGGKKYSKLQQELERIRKEVIKESGLSALTVADSTTEPAVAQEIALLDQPLQEVLQAELQNNYLCLGGTEKDFAKLKQELNRRKFWEFRRYVTPAGVRLAPEVSRYMENIIKRNQIRDLLESYPASLETLAQVIKIYVTMDADYLAEPVIDGAKLLKLVQLDIQNKEADKMGMLLKSITTEQHRYTLLSLVFAGEEDGAAKADLVAKMVAEQEKFIYAKSSDKNNLEYALYYSFFSGKVWGKYTYNQLLQQLEKQREALKAQDKVEAVATIDAILQADLQRRLEQKYCCLKEGATVTDFTVLQEDLATNYALRDFHFSENFTPEVKEYLEPIIARNQLRDTVVHYPPAIQLPRFLENYTKITSAKVRKESLHAFMQLADEAARLTTLFKKELALVTTQIKQLEKKQLSELLNEILADAVPRASRITALVKELVQLSPLPKNYAHLFSWEWLTKGYTPYVAELSRLREQESNPAIAGQIDNLIQTELQMDLEERYRWLQEGETPTDSEVTQLKEELEDNFYLTKPFSAVAVGDYIETICNRNRLYRAITRKNLTEFFAALESLPAADLEKHLLELTRVAITPNTILGFIKSDIGEATGLLGSYKINSFKCGYLRELHAKAPAKVKKLFAYCFTQGEGSQELEEAQQKANLFTKLLGVAELFKEENLKPLQNIIYTIYWGMSTTSSKYQPLKDKLDKLAQQVSEVEVRDKIIKALTTTPEELRESQSPRVDYTEELSSSKANEERRLATN